MRNNFEFLLNCLTIDQTIIGLDVDCYLRYVYWTDIGSKQIFKARLDGTDQERVIESKM